MAGKYIIIGGGVYSGIGKGISAASIAFLLKRRGAKVQLIKCDPYLNIDAGSMNPGQHGEVFLCNDGSETDLDLGHYERLAGIEMSSRNIFTSGTLYKELLSDIERDSYNGETIQVIPHLTDKIIDRIKQLGNEADIVIVEIGGTVGDIESDVFYDAARQLKQSLRDDVIIVLTAPVIWNQTVNELKTKPLQNSVKTLQSKGLQPEILLCRTDRELPDDLLDKISRLTNVPRSAVFEAPDVETIYEVPIKFWDRDIDDLIADKFRLRRNGCNIREYRKLVESYVTNENIPVLTIGVICQYENCDEAYNSLKEAIVHAAVQQSVRVNIEWIPANKIKSAKALQKLFGNLDGVVAPGESDVQDLESTVMAIQYIRENRIPFLGICLGMQCGLIEFSRNVLNINDASSEQFGSSQHNVVLSMGSNARQGAYSCVLEPDSLAFLLYQKLEISERHRHDCEVNEVYSEKWRECGLKVSGYHPIDPGGKLIDIMELCQSVHPFFILTQAHPEFQSRLGDPNPLINGLMYSSRGRYIARNTKAE